MLRQLKNNQNGVIFVTVLMMILVATALTISILSFNVSQNMIAENEISNMTAETIGMGAIAYFFANQMSDFPGNPISYTITLDGVTYTVDADIVGPGGVPGYETNSLQINVSY